MAAEQLQTRLREGMVFLAKQEYDQAKDYFNDLLDEYPESAQCYYGLMMAELRVNNIAQLEKVNIHIGDLTSFKRALSFSDPAFKSRLEAIKQKNEDYIRSKLEMAKTSAQETKPETKPETEPVKELKPIKKLEPVKVSEPIQKPEPVESHEPVQVAEKTQEIEDNKVIAKAPAAKKSKTGLIGALIGIAAIAGYFIFSGKPTTEVVEPTVVEKPAKVEAPTSIDLSKPTKFKVGKVEFEMMPCLAGNFMMGSPENELGHDEFEVQHNVTITKPFLIGKYEVSQALFEEVTGYNYSKYYGLDNPVDSVSYNDAKEFCKKLNEKTSLIRPAGYQFDIPTEAQWEYACRAGSNSAINSGKDLTSDSSFCENLDEVGWYVFNAMGITHPVGQKKPNEWGIYDMHGNVGEWCKDWYHENYDLQNTTDPVAEETAHSHVVRGGNFVVVPYRCRSASRNMAPAESENISTGFRLVLVTEN